MTDPVITHDFMLTRAQWDICNESTWLDVASFCSHFFLLGNSSQRDAQDRLQLQDSANSEIMPNKIQHSDRFKGVRFEEKMSRHERSMQELNSGNVCPGGGCPPLPPSTLPLLQLFQPHLLPRHGRESLRNILKLWWQWAGNRAAQQVHPKPRM